MKHIYDLAHAQLDTPSIVTIGVFDGVHRGHAHLIQRLVEQSHSSGRLAVVLTFFPHPDIVLRGLKGRYYLTTAEERAAQLLRLGVDVVVTHPFNDALRQVRAADFVDQLIQHLRMNALWVGADFALGYKREGNVEFLRERGQSLGFGVEVVNLVETGTEQAVISSTLIRQMLENGDVERAAALLGRGYAVYGEVVHGEKRGRRIGFPTANVAVWQEQVLPANGVYAGWAVLNGEPFMAVTNIGLRPTFSGEEVTVEAHLLDFNREIYGQKLVVTFEKRLRSEQKFGGIEALIAQIAADAEAGRAFLRQQTPQTP